MATLVNAHFCDSDITEGTSAANNDWTSGTGATAQARATTYPEDRAHLNGQTVDILDDGVVAEYYLLSFDGADENNPIEVNDTLASGTKTGTCISITYTTSATGTMVYILDDIQFADDDEITGGGNTIDVDGTPETTGQVVANGVVIGITGTYHIGLNYVSTVKPSKLDIEGMGIILTKKITKAIVSFYQTLKGKVGHSTSAMETVSFGTELFDGIKEVPLADGYDRDGDIIIQQDEPLPMTCRGLVLDVGAHLK